MLRRVASPSATRPSCLNALSKALAHVFSRSVAVLRERVLKYSCGVSSTCAVPFRYVPSFGLRTAVGEVDDQCTAPVIANCSGISLTRLTPGCRG